MPDTKTPAAEPAEPSEPSGTDALFPDTFAHPVVAFDRPRSRRGLGIAALILGLLAVLGDVIGIVVAFVTLAGAVSDPGGTLGNVDDSLGAFLGVIVLEFAVYAGGILVGALAVLLGILAAARGRGRVPGVVGAILGAIVLVAHVALGIVIATSGTVPGVTG